MGAKVGVGRLWQVILAFSISTPIGIMIGGGVDCILGPRATALAEGVFDGVAAGTFIYIAALDVIHEGFFHRRASWLDMALFVGALGVMLELSLSAERCQRAIRYSAERLGDVGRRKRTALGGSRLTRVRRDVQSLAQGRKNVSQPGNARP